MPEKPEAADRLAQTGEHITSVEHWRTGKVA